MHNRRWSEAQPPDSSLCPKPCKGEMMKPLIPHNLALAGLDMLLGRSRR
ncbi:MAG: hypothetical protein LBF88_11925 [Planctomycetaceae bacterium]|nr:hypothetical protein [Planctomycetaceae bacterium]